MNIELEPTKRGPGLASKQFVDFSQDLSTKQGKLKGLQRVALHVILDVIVIRLFIKSEGAHLINFVCAVHVCSKSPQDSRTRS